MHTFNTSKAILQANQTQGHPERATDHDQTYTDSSTHQVEVSEVLESRRHQHVSHADDFVVPHVPQDIHFPVDALCVGLLPGVEWSGQGGGGAKGKYQAAGEQGRSECEGPKKENKKHEAWSSESAG